MSNSEKVSIETYHLKGKAKEWLQWLCGTYQQENMEVTWHVFKGELWARFGPPKGVNFNKALNKL